MDARLIQTFFSTVAASVVFQTGAIAETVFPELQGWTFSEQEQSLAFQTDTTAQPSVFVLREPSRIVIDIKGTSWPDGTVTRSYSGKIGGIRLAEFTEGVTRFVLEASEPSATLNAAAFRLRSFPTDGGATLWQLNLGSTGISSVNATTSTNNNSSFPPVLLPPATRGSVTVPSPPIPNNLRK